MNVKYTELNKEFEIRWFAHLYTQFVRARNMIKPMLYSLMECLDTTKNAMENDDLNANIDLKETKIYKTTQILLNYMFDIHDDVCVLELIKSFSLWCQRYDHWIFDIIREYYEMTDQFELSSFVFICRRHKYNFCCFY